MLKKQVTKKPGFGRRGVETAAPDVPQPTSMDRLKKLSKRWFGSATPPPKKARGLGFRQSKSDK